MGPTNAALVELFRTEQRLREAQDRLDAAERNVRIQDRRVNDLGERLKLAQATLRDQQAKVNGAELEIASRDAHIEKLRTQQQNAKNNKEYQAFLVEINTSKVDRGKIEELLMKTMEAAEKGQAEATTLQQQLDAERAKLETMRAEIGDTVAKLRSEVDLLRPERDAAAAKVPGKAREAFARLAEHHDGEAMAAIDKPDRRREEYVCMACHMELARDVYNKLRTRDELVFCPSCRRILYVPENLSPEDALGTAKPGPKRTRTTTTTRTPRTKATPAAAGADAGDGEDSGGSAVEIELRAKGKLGQVLSKAQGETVRSANAADQKPVECEVYVDDKLAGIYKGQTPEHLLRAINYFLGEAGMTHAVRVVPAQQVAEDEPAVGAGATAGASEPAGDPTAAATAVETPAAPES